MAHFGLIPGYRGNPAWRDMSDYAVHFTKPTGDRTAYDAMISILWEGRIRPGGPFGAAKNLNGLGWSQYSACLSEIPLDLLSRLIERRSLYGIAFRQDFLVGAGGARVWYLDKDGQPAESFKEMVRTAMVGGIRAEDPIWRVTPYVDYPGEYPVGLYRFEWEREWRVSEGLRFQPQDVPFLFLPEEWHLSARDFFERAQRENTGPAYLCPYVDPTWSMDRMQAAFHGIAPLPPVEAPLDLDDTCDWCGGPVLGGICVACGFPAG